MNNKKIASELVRMAKELVAGASMEQLGKDLAKSVKTSDWELQEVEANSKGFTIQFLSRIKEMTLSVYGEIKSGKLTLDVETYDIDSKEENDVAKKVFKDIEKSGLAIAGKWLNGIVKKA